MKARGISVNLIANFSQKLELPRQIMKVIIFPKIQLILKKKIISLFMGNSKLEDIYELVFFAYLRKCDRCKSNTEQTKLHISFKQFCKKEKHNEYVKLSYKNANFLNLEKYYSEKMFLLSSIRYIHAHLPKYGQQIITMKMRSL